MVKNNHFHPKGHKNRFKPFVHCDASYNSSTSRFSYTQGLPDKSVEGHYYSASVGLGAGYFVSKRLSIDATATLGIASLESAFKYRELDPSNRLLLLGIGANWYLSPKAKK